MKKLLINVVAFVAISLCANAQIEMNSSGNVGIGTAPNSSYKLYTFGSAYATTVTFNNFITSSGMANLKTDWNYYAVNLIPTINNTGYLGYSDKCFYKVYCYDLVETSDARQKENIKTINGSLDAILKLRGVTYDLKPEYVIDYELDVKINDNKYKEEKLKKSKNQLGFLAQEVEKVLPNVISYDDSTDVYGINYTRIIPIVVEAIKEQQAIIDGLEREIAALKTGKTQKSAEIGGESSTQQQNQLFQNSPNPFTNSTEIKYAIADNVQNAMLNIYNMSGTQLKSIRINEMGSGALTINGSEFVAGMYMYALIADGQMIDTKQMVLTD